MISSSYIEILKSLTQEELDRLDEFLNSPYYNKSNIINKLFNAVAKYYPKFDSPKLEKTKIYSKIYPGKVYNDQVLRNLFSDSIKLFLQFLKIENFNSNKFVNTEAILVESNVRLLDNIFNKTLKTIQDEFFKHGNITTDYFNFKRSVESNLFSYVITTGNQDKTQKYILNLLDYGYYDYLIKFFDKYFDLKINEYVYNRKDNIEYYYKLIEGTDFESILKKIKNSSETEFIIFRIFYLIFKCIHELTEDRYYFELKNLYKINFKLFAKGTNVIISNRIESICILKGIYGKKEFEKEEFDIMKFAIENELHKKEGSFMDITRFRNIFNRGLSIGDLEWVDNFVSKYINELKDEFKEDMGYYCKAMLSFYKKDFDGSQNYLNKMKLNKFIFNLDYRRLMLMIYFEKNDFLSAKNLTESFRNYIYKNKNVSDTRKKNLIAFINNMNDLIEASEGNKNSYENLDINLSKGNKIMNGDWFKNKLKQIKIN